MKKENNCPDRLIARFLKGEASDGETKVLLDWIEEDEANKDLFLQLKKIWNETGALKLYFDREKEWKKLHRQLTKIRRHNYHGFWVRFSQTAAVFFIAFVIGWFIKAHYTDKTESTWLEVSVPTGHMTQLKLSDSSKVWLNSESTFRYPSDFSDERRVLLSGEAYFEVAPKRESPFIVETDCLSARVLGTRFNVRAYKEDSEIETTLMEGKVALNNNGTQNTRTVLYSGDQARMNKLNNELEIRQVEHPQAKTIAWIKGRYEFHNEPLNEILNFASRWYDIKFVVKDKELQDTRFTGVMRREYPPEKLLELIKKTEEIVTKRKNDKIIIKYQ